MKSKHRWIIVLAIAALPLAGCNKSEAIAKPAAPKANAVAVQAPGGVKRITLKDIETRRLGIAYVEVSQSGDRLTMPYNALLYDPSGGEWAFASPEANVYHRTALKVEAIEGDEVILAQGPAPGTRIVSHGAAELYGIEFGVGK